MQRNYLLKAQNLPCLYKLLLCSEKRNTLTFGRIIFIPPNKLRYKYRSSYCTCQSLFGSILKMALLSRLERALTFLVPIINPFFADNSRHDFYQFYGQEKKRAVAISKDFLLLISKRESLQDERKRM